MCPVRSLLCGSLQPPPPLPRAFHPASPTASRALLCSPQLGWNILGYLLLRFTKPRYLPLTACAPAAAAPPLPPLAEAADEQQHGATKA